MRSRWRIAAPFSAVIWPPDDGGDARRRARTAHTARQAERARPEAGRQTAETAGMQGRAPRAQPTAPQARGTRARPPSPAIISARVFAARRTRRGEGGSALRRARRGKGGKPPRQGRYSPAAATQTLRQAPTQAAGGAPRPRRQDARARREPASRTHGRARPAAKPTRRTAQRRPAGAGVAPPPPHAQQRHDHASGRRRGGQGGRRRRRPGGTRTREQAATHAISAEKTPRKDAQAASAPDAEREGQGAPANPPELLGLHPLGRGRTRQKRGAAARRPPTAFRFRRILCDGRRSGWADSVSLPSLPRFTAFGGVILRFSLRNDLRGVFSQIWACNRV